MAIGEPPVLEPMVEPDGRPTRAWAEWFDEVLTEMAATQTDGAAVSSITLASGADSVDRATFNTDLATLVSEINALKDVVNDLIDKLQAAGLME